MNHITFAFKNIMGKKKGHLQEKWKFETNSPLLSSPVIGDIDNDGKMEIIFGTKDGKILSIDMDGSLKWSYAVQGNYTEMELMFLDAETSNSINSSPNIEDINNDGKKEIVFGTEDGTLYVLDSTGKIFWSFKTQGPIRGSALVQKFANNQCGIIFGSTDKNIYFLNAEGKLLWKYACSSPIESCPHLVLGAKPLIIFGTNNGEVHALDLRGNLIWTYNAEKKILAQALSRKVGNRMLIFIGSTSGDLHCIDEQGSPVWKFCTGGAICSKVALADLNNDGVDEIVFGSCDNNVYALDINGKELWSYETDFWVVANPIIADLDGDGKLEIIVGSYDHNIYILDCEGSYVLDYVPGVSGIVAQTGHYGDAVTKGPGKTKGQRIWQYQTEGNIVGCAYMDSEKNIIINTESGKIKNLMHKQE